MKDSDRLNVLGCVPFLLNTLLELADEAAGIKKFNILKNIPVETGEEFIPQEEWEIGIFDFDQQRLAISPNELFALSVVGTDTKEIVYNWFKKQIVMHDKQFINLIHPTSYVSKSVNLNYGLHLEQMCTIAARTSIGFGVNVKRNSSIGHHCEIGNFVTINPGVTLSGEIKMGNNTMIGSGVSIRDGVTIGENSIVGMGSVVVKDIPANSIAYGNPCKVHKENIKS